MNYIASTELSLQYIPLESFKGKDSYEYATQGEDYNYLYVVNRAESLEGIIENILNYFLGQDRECLLEVGYRPSIDDEDDYGRIEFSFLSDEDGNSLNQDLIEQLKANTLKGWITVVEFEVYLDQRQLTSDDYKAAGILNLND